MKEGASQYDPHPNQDEMLHCGPRLKQDETLGERHSHTRLYAASSNCELYSSA